MNAATQSFLIGRSRRKEALTLCLGLLAALLTVSCAVAPQQNSKTVGDGAPPKGSVTLSGPGVKWQPQKYDLDQGDTLDAVLSSACGGVLGGAWTRGRDDVWVDLIRETNGETTRATFSYGLMSKTKRDALKLRNGDILEFWIVKWY